MTAGLWARLAAALLLLNAALTFVSVWPTLRVTLSWRLSIEAAAAVLLLAAVLRRRAWRRDHTTERVLALVWVILLLSHYAEVSTRALYGRSVNLYWDLQLLPDVGAMFAYVAQPRIVIIFLVSLLVVPAALYVPLRWAFAQLGEGLAVAAPTRRALLLLAAGALALAGVQQLRPETLPALVFAPPVSLSIASEAAELVGEAARGARPLPQAPDLGSDLSQVRGADVILLFVESYGVVSLERDDLRQVIEPARQALRSAIAETGRDAVSTVVESTTFGGESWLAHISLLSGTAVRDQDLNRRLMADRRATMVTTFAQGGYRTLAVMPGLQAAWPEGAFYGFDRIYGANDLGYQGPPFGWWDVTDQFVLARADALAFTPPRAAPAFVFLPSISTHAPFTPVPPYQPDWNRLLTTSPYYADALSQAYDETPDWENLSPGYARALRYTLETIAGYLRWRADRDLVLVVVGDHQPAALVSGEGASWNVPVHVIASRPALLDRLRSHGFRDGLTPGGTAVARLDELTRILLDAFGDTAQTNARRESR